MKTLTIVRHAKSDWGDPSLDDHNRPLNDRGRRVAPLIGEILATHIAKPDIILSSTAIRARTTAGIIAEKLSYPDSDIVDEAQIYLADTYRLLSILRQIDESHSSAIIFGHVPGVQELTNTLCATAQIGHFPTCCVAITQLKLQYWGEIDTNCGTLVELLIPKALLENG